LFSHRFRVPTNPTSAEGHQDWIESSGIRSLIMAPLVAGGTTFGILILRRDVTAMPYDETDLALCVDLAERGPQALHNARLMDQVVRADAARAAARERLSRAERMEGLGLLAGGGGPRLQQPARGHLAVRRACAGRRASRSDTADSLTMIRDGDRGQGSRRAGPAPSGGRRRPATPGP